MAIPFSLVANVAASLPIATDLAPADFALSPTATLLLPVAAAPGPCITLASAIPDTKQPVIANAHKAARKVMLVLAELTLALPPPLLTNSDTTT